MNSSMVLVASIIPNRGFYPGLFDEKYFKKKLEKYLVVHNNCVHLYSQRDGNPAMDYNMYDVCKKYKDCWITAPTSANEYEWGLFPYLTENARIYCERLIKHLADALMEKSSSDRETMSIRVIIENYTTMKIYIKNPHEILDEKVIGTVAWVKKELSRSKLVLNPFSIKSDSLPCVALVFPERTIQIAIANSSEYFRQNPLGMRQYSHNKDIYILYAKKDKDLRHDGLFGYLTPDAERIVYDFIIACAGALSKYINNKKSCNQHNNPQ